MFWHVSQRQRRYDWAPFFSLIHVIKAVLSAVALIVSGSYPPNFNVDIAPANTIQPGNKELDNPQKNRITLISLSRVITSWYQTDLSQRRPKWLESFFYTNSFDNNNNARVGTKFCDDTNVLNYGSLHTSVPMMWNHLNLLPACKTNHNLFPRYGLKYTMC